jgi:hypothetical protein
MAAAALASGACGGGGGAKVLIPGTDGGTVGGIGPDGCSDLFDPKVLPTYSIEISADEWSKLDAEFHDVASVLAGTPPESYHPIVFHYGKETVKDAAIRLKGQSSWVATVMADASPKMQFVIAFDQTDPNGKFHGVDNIHLDMPRDDWTFMHERVAKTWFREIGIATSCANNARLEINGKYYGVYVNEGKVGKGVLEQFFTGNSDGDLFKGGTDPETNKDMPNWPRLQQLWDARDITAVAAIVDLPNTVLEWAAEAVLDDADGYYGGSHNFYVYDEGSPGYVWLPNDIDTCLDWTDTFQNLSWKQHPLYWWEGRAFADVPGQHYLIVTGDPTWRGRYADAIATQTGKWNYDEVNGWLDAWSAQIADAVAADPHKWATVDQFHGAIAAAHDVATNRPAYLQSFVACEHGQRVPGDDQDADGVPWCNDCRDDDPTVHPGAQEICGNKIDDDCNGLVDDGCPPQQ